MYGQTRLHRRGSVYYFRAMVPKDLRDHFGKREIVYSLRTKDRAEAMRLVRRASVDLDEQFERLRAERAGRAPRTLSHVDDQVIETLCERWRYNALAGDAWGRAQGLSDAEYQEQCAQRAATLDALREALAKGRLERIQPALEAFLHLNGIEFVADSDDMRRLAYAFLETVTETHQAQMARDRGEVVRTPPAPPPLTGPSTEADPAPAEAQALGLDALVARWEALVPDRPADTVASFRRVARAFTDHCGKDRIDRITRGDVIAYRDHLLIEEGRHHGTVSKNLSYLSALFQVGVDAELIPNNPASRIKVPKPKVKKPSRLPYDTEHLNAIFRCPIYTEGQRPRGGGGEAAAWLPLLATFTGCRLEELGQLRIHDVDCDDGIHYLTISDLGDEDGKQLKTEASRRRLPLHPQLIESGFLRYVERRRTEGQGSDLLFPGLRPDVKGKLTGNWSKWWGRYSRRVIGIQDRTRVFHSFRHGFRDACREADLNEELADALMGHAGNSTGRGYGRSYSLKKLHEAICRIGYPGVVFPVVVPV